MAKINTDKIEAVMRLGRCDRATAIAYLESEENIVSDALVSLNADRRAGVQTA